MHINELPNVVLARILYWTCNDPDCLSPKHYKLNPWRIKLMPLSVCRAWRELALPSVHKKSFVGCIHITKPTNRNGSPIPNYSYLEDSDYEASGSEDPDTHSRFNESDDLEVETYAVKTNLDIIDKKCGKCWPKTVQIFVKTLCDPVYSFQRIIEKICSHPSLLARVRRVELILNPAFGSNLWADKPTSIAEASLIGKKLTQFIPSIKFIEWCGFSDIPVMLEFAKSLIRGYAHQLVGFRYPQTGICDVSGFSDSLRVVGVDRSSDMDYISQICAENLTSLDLKSTGSEFGWSSFENNGSPICLNFDNLKWLRLRIEVIFIAVEATNYWEYPVGKFKYKIIAPKLETVIIELCPFTFSFLSSIYGAKTIENVELETQWAHLSFTGFNLDRARELFASYTKNSQEESQTIGKYTYINDILKFCNLAEYSKARLGYNHTPLDFEQIYWEYLQDIKIYCPLHINDLKILVSRMPNLEKVYVGMLKLKVDGELISEIQDEESIVEPISLSLKHMSVVDIDDYTKNEIEKLNMYLGKLFPRV